MAAQPGREECALGRVQFLIVWVLVEGRLPAQPLEPEGDRVVRPCTHALLSSDLPAPCLRWNGVVGGWHSKPAMGATCA